MFAQTTLAILPAAVFLPTMLLRVLRTQINALMMFAQVAFALIQIQQLALYAMTLKIVQVRIFAMAPELAMDR